jgi:hypothetical protein
MLDVKRRTSDAEWLVIELLGSRAAKQLSSWAVELLGCRATGLFVVSVDFRRRSTLQESSGEIPGSAKICKVGAGPGLPKLVFQSG